MRTWLVWIAVLLGMLALAPARAQEAGDAASAYTIGGIAVDVAAKTPDEARRTAYTLAQRRAWPQLWARMTGTSAASAPHLSDATLESIVAGIEVQGERFSMTRYIATLGVVFDRARASGYFTGIGGALHSEPMLLLPLLHDGGARFVYERKTPWVLAWQRYSQMVSPITYILASGSAGDNILLTAYQTSRPDRPLWRNILNRFRTVDVLVAEAVLTRLYPGGPVDALFIARHGPDSTELGRFKLRAPNQAGLDAMLDAGARGIDAIYSQALQDGRLRSEPDLIAAMEPIASGAPMFDAPERVASAAAIELLVPTPDSAAWTAAEALLRSTPTVAGVTLTSLSIGGSTGVLVQYSESREMLAYQLYLKGMTLAPTSSGLLLRRREPGDPVVTAPVVAPVAPAAAAPAGTATEAPADLPATEAPR
ncbi:heavy-metal-associated domain-containing protein [Polymorphobacter arshaanensis]|uniref:Heavy-metal-associated domain-containing protein n=1 Tax=Glacieibacterium arshaanense TaxID=2511025 RepID=A0A4Y9EPU5_9SPHN|nr:heavy-metal-associated domain-containing protein [Polymorphobacter arshaanensis]TFU03801.1 heavy-metal-associated domain-containing protein [Polymorphobacter arshaanensis]